MSLPSRRFARLLVPTLVGVALLAGLWSLPRVTVPVLSAVGVLPPGMAVRTASARWDGPGAWVFTGIRVAGPWGAVDGDTVRIGFGPGGIRSLRLVRPRLALASSSGSGEGGGALPELGLGSVQVVEGAVSGVRPGPDGAESWGLEAIELVADEVRLGPRPTARIDTLRLRGTSSRLDEPVEVAAGGTAAAGALRFRARVSSSRSDLTLEGEGELGGGGGDLLRSLRGTVEADPLLLADLDPFLPRPLPAGRVRGSARVEGPAGRADGRFDVALDDGGRGSVDGTLVLPREGSVRAGGVVDLEDVPVRLFGLDRAGRVSGDLDLEASGPRWQEVDGEARGRLELTEPAVAGTVEVLAATGELEGRAALDWDGRRVVLLGTGSLGDTLRTWTADASVASPDGDSVRLDLRGQGASARLRALGRVAGRPLDGSGEAVWDSGPRGTMRLGPIPGWLDSARMVVGRLEPLGLEARADLGGGRLALGGAWVEGGLRLDSLRADRWPVAEGASGRWSGTAAGTVSPEDGGVSGALSIRLDSVTGGPAAGLSGTVDATFRGPGAELDARLVRPPGRAELRGAVGWGGGAVEGFLSRVAASWGPDADPRRLSFEGGLGLDARAWTGRGRATFVGSGEDAPTVELDLEAVEGDLEARGAASGSFGHLELDARAAGGWREAGPLTVELLADSLRLVPGAGALGRGARSSGEGADSSSVAVTTDSPAAADSSAAAVAAASSGSSSSVAAPSGGGGPPGLEAVLAGRAELVLPRWIGGVRNAVLESRLSGRFTDLPVDSLVARAEVVEGVGRVAASLTGPGLTLEGRGKVALEPAPRLDSASVRALLEEGTALAAATGGRVAGNGSVEGSVWRGGDGLGGRGSASLTGFRAPAVRAEEATASFHLEEGAAGWSGELEAGLHSASLSGGPEVEAGVSGTVRSGAFEVGAAVGTELALDLSGRVEGRRVRLSDGRLRSGSDTLRLGGPARLAFEELRRPRVEGLRLGRRGGGGGYLSVDSGRDPGSDRWSVAWEVDGLALEPLLSWSPLSRLWLAAGELGTEGSVSLADGEPVLGGGTLGWNGVLEEGEPLSLDASLEMERSRGGLEVRALLDGAPAGLVVSIPRGGSDHEPTFALEASDFLLDPFFVGTGGSVGMLSGARVDGGIRRVGAGDDARLEGDLRLLVDQWEPGSVELAFEDVDVRLRQRGREFDVAGSASSGGGSATVEGSIALGSDGFPVVDLRLDTRRFPVVWSSAMVLRSAGAVRVEGPLLGLRVTGDVRAEQSEILLAGGTSVEAVELTEADSVFLRERFDWRGGGGGRSLDLLLAGMAVDLDAEVGGDVWVRRWGDPELALALEGDVAVRKEPGGPFEYLGTLTPRPEVSSFRQFSRRFSLTSGSIQLLGPPEETEFTVTGEHAVASRTDPGSPEAVISLTVQGSPDDLSVVLESEPSMEQADIVSYLLLGQPSGELGSSGGETAAEAGAGIALSTLSSLLAEAGARAVGLDVVNLEPRGLGGLTLVVGRFITPRLFVAVRQPVAWEPGSEATGVVRLAEVETEFRAARWLLLNLEGDAEGFGLFLRTRFAY